MEINLPPKRYYTIGEIAQAFNVNASKIRFWEKEFEILSPKKNAKGTRKYTSEDVQNFHLIFNLVEERGYTLEGARIKLREDMKKTLSNFEIVQKLEHIKSVLQQIKNEL